MRVETDSPPDAGAAACPCRRGDVAAEVARQRPLLERAARGDREAFARLYLTQVDGVYRYLLAWTGTQAAAKELTEQVFRAALAWLPITAGGEAGAPRAGVAGAPHADVDVGAWLVALARDAVTQRREAGWMAGPERADGQPPPTDTLEAAARLGDPEREVVVLRLLLGHSLVHTAQLSGYSRRAVTELQLAACLAIRELTVEPGEPAPPPDLATVGSTAPGQRAAEFERRLERWDVDLTGDDPGLADALAIASSLRLAAPSQVLAPDRRFVLRLRAALASEHPEASGGGAPRPARRALAALRAEMARRPRPFAATAVAAAAILVILTLQAFGSPKPPACGGRPCPTTTTAAAAAPASATAVPLTSIRQATTTASLPATTALAAPVSTAPPATSPASTAPRTTRPPRTTTTRQPTTTASTTTSTTTTTVPTTST